MDLDLSEEQQMVIDMTRAMLEEHCPTQVVRDAEDDPKGDAHGGPGRKVSCCLSQGGAGRETDANTEGQKGARGLAHRPTPVR